eukprot:TRINITY_DN597_c0_g1_i1.p2 TRINITY_DN597_c0_g1~~TRINITY_DN597_c0_g1_i1.p2  ORF type:complete len:218 (-),score=16.32 TRINITY_DN597_c0_g1_i1:196-849(-)
MWARNEKRNYKFLSSRTMQNKLRREYAKDLLPSNRFADCHPDVPVPPKPTVPWGGGGPNVREERARRRRRNLPDVPPPAPRYVRLADGNRMRNDGVIRFTNETPEERTRSTTFLPRTIAGGPHQIRRRVADAFEVSATLGKANLFFTATLNTSNRFVRAAREIYPTAVNNDFDIRIFRFQISTFLRAEPLSQQTVLSANWAAARLLPEAVIDARPFS